MKKNIETNGTIEVRGTGYGGEGAVTYERRQGGVWVPVSIGTIRAHERAGRVIHWNPSK